MPARNAARGLPEGPQGCCCAGGMRRAYCRTMQARQLPSTSPSARTSAFTVLTNWPRVSNWLPSPISAWMRAWMSAQPAPLGIVVLVVEVATVLLVVLVGAVVLVTDVLVVVVMVVLVDPGSEVDVVLEVLVDVVLVDVTELLVVDEVEVVLVTETLVVVVPPCSLVDVVLEVLVDVVEGIVDELLDDDVVEDVEELVVGDVDVLDDVVVTSDVLDVDDVLLVVDVLLVDEELLVDDVLDVVELDVEEVVTVVLGAMVLVVVAGQPQVKLPLTRVVGIGWGVGIELSATVAEMRSRATCVSGVHVGATSENVSSTTGPLVPCTTLVPVVTTTTFTLSPTCAASQR